jgi:hypothetical protein
MGRNANEVNTSGVERIGPVQNNNNGTCLLGNYLVIGLIQADVTEIKYQ